MMQKITDQLLVECLDLLEQGVSVANVLSRYPEQAAALRPYLETAVSLDKLVSSPTLRQKQQSRQAMLAQATALQGAQMTQPPVWGWLRRLLMPLAALTVLLFLFGGSLLSVSAAALPGDMLYNSKRWAEQVQVQLAQSPEQKLTLVERQQAERVREVQALLRTERNEVVSFDGNLQEITPNFWVISDVDVQLTDETEIDGTPQLAVLVRVNGRVREGQLRATRLEMLASLPEDDPDPEPVPTRRPIFSTSTATATPTARFTATTTATTTETAVPTSSSTPTKTVTPTNTPTPQPSPSATPIHDDDNDNDANENEDDNHNDANDNDDNNGNDDNNANGDDGDNENGDHDNENSGNNDDNENDNENDNDDANENEDENEDENDNDDDANENN